MFGSLADLRMDMMPVLCVLGGRGGEGEVLTLIVMNSCSASSSSAGADSSRVFVTVVGGAGDR